MKFIDYVVKYWVIVVFTVGGISSIAVAGAKISTIEEAVKKQTEQNVQVQEIKTEQKLLTQKTDTLLEQFEDQKEDMKAQRELLLQILLKVKEPAN